MSAGGILTGEISEWTVLLGLSVSLRECLSRVVTVYERTSIVCNILLEEGGILL